MLKLQFKDRRRESVWLVDTRFSIGKSNQNSLMIEDASIEDKHAEIVNQQEQLFIYKKSPSASIKVNGVEITESQPIKATDSLTLGQIELELIDSKTLSSNPSKQHPWSLHSNASWLEKSDYIITEKTIIGRDPGCDIALSLDYLSRKHVSLEPINGKLIIEDLNSSNGTFVNGEKISKAELQPGDKIKLDVLTFEVRGPAGAASGDPHKTIIRSRPAQTSTTSTPNESEKPIQTPVRSTQTDNKERLARRRRLAAEGKQAWISGDNQLKPKPERKKNNRAVIALIIVLMVTGAALFIFKP